MQRIVQPGRAEQAINKSRVEMGKIRLVVDYGHWESLARDVERLGGRVLDKEFGEQVTVLAEAPLAEAAALRERFGGA